MYLNARCLKNFGLPASGRWVSYLFIHISEQEWGTPGDTRNGCRNTVQGEQKGQNISVFAAITSVQKKSVGSALSCPKPDLSFTGSCPWWGWRAGGGRQGGLCFHQPTLSWALALCGCWMQTPQLPCSAAATVCACHQPDHYWTNRTARVVFNFKLP